MTRDWAHHHHPNWYRTLLAEEKVRAAEQRTTPAADGDRGTDSREG